MILKQIDPDSRYFKKKLYKTSCQRAENGLYIKNLALIGHNLARTVLVDNSTFSFGHQLLNGVPIVSFTGSDTDTELMSLQDYLLHLSKAPDVRKVNLDYFKYPVFIEHLEQGPDAVFQKIFSQAS
jgi:CTD small phosphatase-like protein 2